MKAGSIVVILPPGASCVGVSSCCTVKCNGPPQALVAPFFEEIRGLGEKLAAVLVQLPPKREFEPAAAKELFAAVRAHHAGDLACEPRHASWFTPEAEQKNAKSHALITGFGYFSTDPARPGDAPNGIELHPVTGIKFLLPEKAPARPKVEKVKEKIPELAKQK